MKAGYWAGLLLAGVSTAGAQEPAPSYINYQGVLRGGTGEHLPQGPQNIETL